MAVQLRNQQLMSFAQSFANNALAGGHTALAQQTFNTAMVLHATSIDVTAAAATK